MTDFIRRLAARLGLLVQPCRTSPASARPRRPAPAAPCPGQAPLPAPRSPYGLDTPLDGAATVAVRPYLAAHEQRQRRRELAMAALGLDMPGPYWIHGLEVA